MLTLHGGILEMKGKPLEAQAVFYQMMATSHDESAFTLAIGLV